MMEFTHTLVRCRVQQQSRAEALFETMPEAPRHHVHLIMTLIELHPESLGTTYQRQYGLFNIVAQAFELLRQQTRRWR